MTLQNERIEHLIQRYLKLYTPTPVPKKKLEEVEQILEIVLPYDFMKITEVYEGDTLGVWSLFLFKKYKGDYNIVDRTLFYRKCDALLPHRFLALMENDVSFIVMETQDHREKLTPIIECSIGDAYNLAQGKPLEDNPRIFPSFTDFFEYLLDEEEKERAEEEKENTPS